MIRSWLAIILSTAAVFAQQTHQPAISSEPISADRMVIYQDFLKHYNNGSRATLNLAQTTITFEPRDYDRTGCLKQFKPEELRSSSVRTFPTDAFRAMPIRLVDAKGYKLQDPGKAIRKGQSVEDAVSAGFAAGIFTFSEIVFDAGHTHAAFSYSFVCGGLCGHGGAIVYEFKDGKWVQAKISCGSWIS